MFKLKNNLFRRVISVSILTAFFLTSLKPIEALAQTAPMLPSPGIMMQASPAFTPATMRGLTINPDNPLEFDFIIHPGDDNLKGAEFQAESMKLIKYFMAALTVPEDELWVNLSPNGT